jgi:hypothetical protein
MHRHSTASQAKAAGLLYALIIVLGLSSEILLRGPLFHAGDPAATAAAVLGAEGLLRLSVLADMAMASADVALAVLLLWLFRPVDLLLAALAVAFRLAQAVVIAANLLNLHGALLVLKTPGLAPDTAAAIAYGSLDLHRHGYDLGLVFFGVNALLMGVLILRATGFPRWLGHLMTAAGIVYLSGSTLRFAAPDLGLMFQPAYVVAMVAEVSFAVLLLKGRLPAAAKTWTAGDARLAPPASSV